MLHSKKIPATHSVLAAKIIDTDEGTAVVLESFQVAYTFDCTYATVATGIQFSPQNIDFTATGIYWLFRTDSHDLGFGTTYHFFLMQQISMTHDLLAGVFYKLQPCRWFSFSANFDYMLKLRKILAVAQTNPIFEHHTLACSLRTNFYPSNKAGIFIEAASYEFFRYNIFCAPTFSVGAAVNFTQHFSLLCSAKIRYIDFFTLSAGYDNSEFSLMARYSF